MKWVSVLFSAICTALLLVFGSAFAGEKSAKLFRITLTSDSDGRHLVETRPMTAAEIAMLTAGGEVTHEATSQGTPPLQPPAPAADAYPATLNRVDYHQETYGWMRDTSYTRLPGAAWRLISDQLQATLGPVRCEPKADDCSVSPH